MSGKRTYHVNGERQETEQRKLTPKAILEKAGFEPHSDYRLTRDDGNKILEDHDKEEPIHDGERFTATYVGTTPVS
jgi:hypothetical protein